MKQLIIIIVAIVLVTGVVMLWGDQDNNMGQVMNGETLQTGVNNFEEVEMSALENTIYMDVSSGGRVVIKTFPDKAPNHVARFKELTREGYYDGVVFHRVIEGFMAQTGDPTGTGSGGSGQNIDAEFNDIHHSRGIVSTARAMDPNSADSQFFIMLADAPHLDGQYTVWGEVVEGMEFIDAITKGPRENNGTVPEADRDSILTMVVAIDADTTDNTAEAENETVTAEEEATDDVGAEAGGS